MKVFLVGFMGSGKTTLGKKVAQKLDLPFYDCDKLIENSEETSIAKIFKEKGEDSFRKLESNLLIQLRGLESGIISTGGGMPCFSNNLQEMQRQGIIVYLQLSPAALLRRLMDSPNERPLINGKTKEELLQYIQNLLDTRSEFYEQADLIIQASNLSSNQLIEKIIPYFSSDSGKISSDSE
jgi:shikimate kinase